MIFARRFYWVDIDPLDITALLDEFVAHPEFLTHPHPPEVARQVGAGLLTDVNHLVWATYDDKKLTGVVLLTHVIPQVNALLHFLFLDKKLSNKRKLLRNLITHCFKDLGFNRLTMEVPEGVRLERFARKVLDFRYEGEKRPRNPELPASLTDNWVARQGSRIEQGYFNGQVWSDILRLRLLASEWVGEPGEVPCRSEPLLEPLPPSSEDL